MKIGGAPTQADFHEAISARSDHWYSACLKITRNPDMAADAVQDALLNAWNKRHQFEQCARLDTWIHRIAINAALNQIRKSKPGVIKHLEQWRVKEISAELNLNEGRIKQAIFRAVKKLRVSMQDMQREDDERP